MFDSTDWKHSFYSIIFCVSLSLSTSRVLIIPNISPGRGLFVCVIGVSIHTRFRRSLFLTFPIQFLLRLLFLLLLLFSLQLLVLSRSQIRASNEVNINVTLHQCDRLLKKSQWKCNKTQNSHIHHPYTRINDKFQYRSLGLRQTIWIWSLNWPYSTSKKPKKQNTSRINLIRICVYSKEWKTNVFIYNDV